MLLVVVSIGESRYAVDASHVVEVLPLLDTSPPAPLAPAAVSGICNYRGRPAAVIDLNRLAGLPAAPRLLSTRLLIVSRGSTYVALLAAAVTETIHLSPQDFLSPPSTEASSPSWIGPMARYGTGFLRRLEIDPLFDLAEALR